MNIKRLQQLAGILTEIKINQPILRGKYLINFCEQNKQEISSLNPYYKEVILENPVELLDKGFWEDDEETSYDDYTQEDFMNDWDKYEGTIAMMGEELSTCFVTTIPLPQRFACVATGNDLVFFGTRSNNNNPFKEYEIQGRKIYIVWGIPDPGS